MKKPYKLILGLGVITFGIPLMALETDNYLSWGIDLEDSSEDINTFMAEQVQSALDEANTKENPQSCEDVTFAISKKFKTTPTTKSLETFVNESLPHGKLYPVTPYYLEQSILRNTSRFYLKYSGLAPNIQIAGIYLGADKLSHFASTGRRYLKHYLKKIRKGRTEQEALESMIRFGLWNEATILGIWASGVFSYGDMEANYQGFVFYKKLCLDKENNYLEQTADGKWKMKKTPDMRDYISPYWDETYNLSYLAKGTWKRSSLIIKSDYCGLRKNQKVLDRLSYYQASTHSSFSLNYINELKMSGYKNAPVPEITQSVSELCQSQNLATLP